MMQEGAAVARSYAMAKNYHVPDGLAQCRDGGGRGAHPPLPHASLPPHAAGVPLRHARERRPPRRRAALARRQAGLLSLPRGLPRRRLRQRRDWALRRRRGIGAPGPAARREAEDDGAWEDAGLGGVPADGPVRRGRGQAGGARAAHRRARLLRQRELPAREDRAVDGRGGRPDQGRGRRGLGGASSWTWAVSSSCSQSAILVFTYCIPSLNI
jgi:hypothetical protein